MELVRKKIQTLAPEHKLVAEGAMRAQVERQVVVPPEAPIPDESDEAPFDLDMTPWEALVDATG